MQRAYTYDTEKLRVVEATADISGGNLPVWVDLCEPSRDEERALEALLGGIDIPTREDVQEIELSNRLYFEKGTLYLTATLLGHDDPDNKPVARGVSFILTAKTLVTVRYHALTAFDIGRTRLQRQDENPNPLSVLVLLLESVIGHGADIIETLANELDELSHCIFGDTNPDQDLQALLRALGRKGDVIGMMKESLVSVDRMLAFINVATSEQDTPRDLILRLQSLNRDQGGLGDHVTFLSNKVNFLLDASLGLIANAQNNIIRILSVAAVIFLPPTLIASIYGMNFAHMPELNTTYGYGFALLAMAVSAVAPYFYFKKRKWL
jgi:magnesium transporter